MLLNDDKFILQKDHSPLRRAMLILYGLSVSPASDVMKTWIESTTGGEYKPEESAIEIKGTHGWKWRVSDANPLVNGFTIWFKKKHQRKWTKVVTDSTNFEYNYHYDDVLSILELSPIHREFSSMTSHTLLMNTSCNKLQSTTHP